MAPFNPGDPGGSERTGEHHLQVERLALGERIEVLNDLREQLNTKSLHRAAGLVAGLVLIEPPVRIA